jgi:hypothetical protein
MDSFLELFQFEWLPLAGRGAGLMFVIAVVAIVAVAVVAVSRHGSK